MFMQGRRREGKGRQGGENRGDRVSKKCVPTCGEGRREGRSRRPRREEKKRKEPGSERTVGRLRKKEGKNGNKKREEAETEAAAGVELGKSCPLYSTQADRAGAASSSLTFLPCMIATKSFFCFCFFFANVLEAAAEKKQEQKKEAAKRERE